MRRRILTSNNDIIPPGDVNGYRYVDMGEGVGVWATCNVGANKPEDYGLYFAWGETEGSKNGFIYNWGNYKFGGSSTVNSQSKYNSTDKLTVLEPEDDAAHVIMGGDWRMPTKDELKTLCDACNITWVAGRGAEFTLKTDSSKQLFFPAAGATISGTYYSGTYGYYWASTLGTPNYEGSALVLMSGYTNGDGLQNRYYGLSVRAVLETPKIEE